MTARIYLDNSATTRLLPEVVQEITACWQLGLANPASQHADGRDARQKLNTAKRALRRMLGLRDQGACRDPLIVTSGGTESNNLAIRGLVSPYPPGRILLSSIEHPSVQETAQWLGQRGFDVCPIPVDGNGGVDPHTLRSLITEDTQLVSVMLGNNETGVLQPIHELAAVCHSKNTRLHTDAVQAVGKFRVHFEELGVDALSVSAHKFHGPRGVGLLALKSTALIRPILWGGSQQQGLRPGTENIAMVCGMAKALECFESDVDRSDRLAQLRNQLESTLARSLNDLHIHGQISARLPHITNISFVGWDRQALLMALDQVGISCATGSACSSGSSEPSHVLRAMGADPSLVASALRFSVGADTREEEIEAAASRIIQTVRNGKIC